MLSGCTRPTGGSNGRTARCPAQRFKDAMRRPRFTSVQEERGLEEGGHVLRGEGTCPPLGTTVRRAQGRRICHRRVPHDLYPNVLYLLLEKS
jgi:hypothetical protein